MDFWLEQNKDKTRDCDYRAFIEPVDGMNNPIHAVSELEFDEHVEYILSFLNFQTAPFATTMRKSGEYDIPRKSEKEQARVLHWMLNHYIKHGSKWREACQKDMDRWLEKEKLETHLKDKEG